MKSRAVWLIAALVFLICPLLIAGAAGAGLTLIAATSLPQTCATSSDGSSSCTDGALPTVDSGWNFAAPTAADGLGGQAALAAVAAVGRGGRYVAEGNGPVDFDCSGLTSWAWRQVGVSLPDYSYSQWDVTARISREQLQPGDLVFWFGGDVHHVAIVVAVDGGRVRIAEAANPDAGVRIRGFGDSWDQAYVSGYGRVIHT